MKLRAALVSVLISVVLPLAGAQTAIRSANVTYTTVDYPGAGFSGATGINSAGVIVGGYGTINNGENGHGFMYDGATFTSIDYPGAYLTSASGINDAGVISGSANFEGGLIIHGFTYDGTTFTTFNVPGSYQTIAWGLNNLGQLACEAGDFGSATRAYEMVNGKFKLLHLQSKASLQGASAINNVGQIAAFASDALDYYGWVYKSGQVKSLVVPGSSPMSTEAHGINDKGIVVGWYFVETGALGFAYSNGKYVSLAVPGATETYASGINNAGQIVGGYELPDFSQHGFVTSPLSAEDFQ